MGKKPLVSICVLSFDRPHGLRRTMQAIQKHTPDIRYEVLILDQNSNKATRRLVQQLGQTPFVHVWLGEENLGCAGGRQFLLEQAQGEFIVQLDNDIEVGPGWLTQLLKVLRSDEKVAGVCAVVVQPSGQIE